MQKIISLLIFGCFSCLVHAQDIELQDPVSIEFRQDTMMIEQQVANMLDKDYSTAGMLKAVSSLEQGYEKLLNKYYQMLLNRLKEEDRNSLIEAQRNWIKFRDSEKTLIRTISAEGYTGGGTMWGPVAASAAADLTKDRLIDIYHYLTFSIVE